MGILALWWSVAMVGGCHALLYVRLSCLMPPRQVLGVCTWADFRYVCCSVRACVDLADGVHLVVWYPVRQNLGERRPPSITTAKPRTQEGDKGVAKLKCTPAPFLPYPSVPPHVLQPLQPHCCNYYSSPPGVLIICWKFSRRRRNFFNIFLSLFLAILGTFLDPNLLPNRGNTPNKSIH